MKNQSLVPALALALVLAAGVAQADSVNVLAGDASWHAFQTPATAGGTAFWNRWSFDGANHDCNIGYWLSGTGGCSAGNGAFMGNSPKLTPEYLGSANSTWELQKDPNTQSVKVETFAQATAYQDVDEFGWYNTSTPGVLNSLFVGVGVVNATATFFPSGNYGFYLKSPADGGSKFLSNGTGDTQTHFAVFRQSGSYFIGVEDMWRGADFDYNDVIFRVTTSEVPEPASLLLLGTGLVGLGGAWRRRRSAKG